jgi:hypothetical protein
VPSIIKRKAYLEKGLQNQSDKSRITFPLKKTSERNPSNHGSDASSREKRSSMNEFGNLQRYLENTIKKNFKLKEQINRLSSKPSVGEPIVNQPDQQKVQNLEFESYSKRQLLPKFHRMIYRWSRNLSKKREKNYYLKFRTWKRKSLQ